MSAPIEVASGAGKYPVQIEVGALDALGDRMRAVGLSGRAAVVSDRNVFPLCGERALDSLRRAGFDPARLVIPPGEGSKTLFGADALYGELILGGFTRHDCLVALGGGVVGDLAGFVAATFHRGMAFVQAPTTLLAQVDSSVGGKVAVDHQLGKNLIGAFHPPRLVVADVATLSTLSARDRWGGMAEVVKAALIQDTEFLESLERRLEALGQGDAPANEMAEVVRRAVEIKAKVVSDDEHEQGPRMWLNFGHTFGHALEAASGYGPLTHGEAVVQGMRVALEISVKLGRLAAAEAARALALLARFPRPPAWPKLDRRQLHDALFRDKKVRTGKLRFVVLNRLGEASLEPDLPWALVEEGLSRALAPP